MNMICEDCDGLGVVRLGQDSGGQTWFIPHLRCGACNGTGQLHMRPDTPPICPRCECEMKVGIAIGPTRSDDMKNALCDPAESLIDHTILTLDDVWKCPECGHSADIRKSL